MAGRPRLPLPPLERRAPVPLYLLPDPSYALAGLNADSVNLLIACPAFLGVSNALMLGLDGIDLVGPLPTSSKFSASSTLSDRCDLREPSVLPPAALLPTLEGGGGG